MKLNEFLTATKQAKVSINGIEHDYHGGFLTSRITPFVKFYANGQYQFTLSSTAEVSKENDNYIVYDVMSNKQTFK